MPVISVAVAIISAALGVKSTVISMRSPRGRTPTPVDRRFVASSITGTGRMYASSSASFCDRARVAPWRARGSSNEML